MTLQEASDLVKADPQIQAALAAAKAYQDAHRGELSMHGTAPWLVQLKAAFSTNPTIKKIEDAGYQVTGTGNVEETPAWYQTPWGQALIIGGSLGVGTALSGGLTGANLAADVGATTTVPEAGAIGSTVGGTAATAGTIGGAAATTGAAAGGTAAATGGTAAASGGTVGGAAAGGELASTTIAPTVGTLAPGVAASGAVPAGLVGGTTTAATSGGILSSTLHGLTTPQVLGTIVSGAFGVYGASKAADAQTSAAQIVADANKAAAQAQAAATVQAAQIQAQSTAAALDFAKQGYAGEVARYDENQRQLAPYTGSGGAAVTKLSQLMGLGTPPAYVPPVVPPVTPSNTSTATIPATTQQVQGAADFTKQAVANNPALLNVPQTPGPNWGTISGNAAPPSAFQGSTPAQTMPLAAPQSAPMVTLRAPTGEVTQKPATELQHWLSLGAQQVPGTALTGATA